MSTTIFLFDHLDRPEIKKRRLSFKTIAWGHLSTSKSVSTFRFEIISFNITMGTEKNDESPKGTEPVKKHPTPFWVYIALVSIAGISYVALPDPIQPHHGESPTIRHVFYYGWLTAVSTGLGAIPLALAPNLSSYWVGISNGTFLWNLEW